jgi:hypothetical protein
MLWPEITIELADGAIGVGVGVGVAVTEGIGVTVAGEVTVDPGEGGTVHPARATAATSTPANRETRLFFMRLCY